MVATLVEVEPAQSGVKAELKALVGNVMSNLYKWAGVSRLPERTCNFCSSKFTNEGESIYCPLCRLMLNDMQEREALERRVQERKLIDYIAELLLARDKRAALANAFGEQVSLSWLRAGYEKQELAKDGRYLLITQGRRLLKLEMRCNHCGQYCPRSGYAPVFEEAFLTTTKLILLCNSCYRKYGDNPGLAIAPSQLMPVSPEDMWDREFYRALAIAKIAARDAKVFNHESPSHKVGTRRKERAHRVA